MSLTLVPYTPELLEECLYLFMSNTGKYFSEVEKDEYQGFLESLNDEKPYFLVKQGTRYVAAGGYALSRDDTVRMTWGMVNNDLHTQGIGTFLTQERLNKIQAHFPDKLVGMDTSQHTYKFYKKFGFKMLSRELNGYDDGIDKIEMIWQSENTNTITFETDVQLTGDTIYLTPMKEDDFEPLFEVASDPDIWSLHPASDRYKKEVFKDYFESGLQGNMCYLIK